MEVALIPPYSMMHTVRDRKYQMMLPSCLVNPTYRQFYNDIIGKSYVILDNGMFEDSMMSNDRLIDLANMWQVDELVMPDVRGDINGTFEAVDSFLNMFTLINFDKTPNLMIVVQIDSVDQIEEFIQEAAKMEMAIFGRHGFFTFGIPRRLAEDIYPDIRVRIAAYISLYLPDNHIHLLGYSRVKQHGVNEIQALSGMARSMDTDAPYVWACANASLTNRTAYERSAHYMDVTSISDRLLQDNISTLDRWSRGRP